MPNCRECSRKLTLFETMSGICNQCHHDQMSPCDRSDIEDASIQNEMVQAELAAILLTTESNPAIDIVERIEIITAECVMGMNIFKDIGSAFRDVVGGRNQGYQDQLRNARKIVLEDLRAEALDLGANAVVAIQLNYSEISGGGKSMLFIVASGTAVKINTASKPTRLPTTFQEL